MTARLTCKIEQILYNGPVEYSHDFRWVVRNESGKIVAKGTSSSPEWATHDCERNLSLLFPDGYKIEKDFRELPEPIDIGGWHANGGWVFRNGGRVVDWPSDHQPQ